MTAVLTEFTTRGTLEFRKPVLTRVDVSWEDADGNWQTLAARMEDRSAGGACIRAKMPIPVGSKARIQSRQDDFAGEVRHCRADGSDFLIGIQRDVADRPSSSPPVSTRQPNSGNGGAVRPTAVKPSIVSPSVVIPTVVAQNVVAATPKIPNPPKRLENKLGADSSLEPRVEPRVEQVVEPTRADYAPAKGIALATMLPAPEVNRESGNRNISLPHPLTIDPLFLAEVQAEIRAEFRAEVRTEVRTEVRAEVWSAVRQAVRAELQTELQSKQPAMQAGKEEKPMRSKWLELPWRKNPEDPSMSGPEDAEAVEGNSTSNRDKENFMSDLSQSMPKPPVRSAREVPTFQVDLSPMEDIYRAIGIMNPPRGYSITKVVEMLNSEHIRDLSKDMKRAAVLMALDAAGTSLEQLQRDAKARQDALDAHEAQQRKQVEAEWARKAEEIVQIQAEMDSIKAHYTGRISRNLDGVARQKATFAEWVNLKQQECQGMSEAIELCSKSSAPASASASASAPVSSPSSEVSLMKANAKTV
jgi:lambda repressor-like predicted transcriptional regulator